MNSILLSQASCCTPVFAMRRFKTPSQENKMATQVDEKKKSIIPKLTTVCLGVLLAVFLQIGRGGVSADISCEKNQFIAEGECQTCPNNCINCSSATTCHKCNDGFFGPACEHTCPNCSTGHNVCHKVYGHCFLGCKDGTFSSAGICSPCLDHCKICDSLTNCILCDDGHWGTACKQECQGCHRCEKADGKCLPQATDASSVTTDKGDMAYHIGLIISILINIVMCRKHLSRLMCFIIRRIYCIWWKRQNPNEDSVPRQVSSEVRIEIPTPVQCVDNLPKPVEEQNEEIDEDSDSDSDELQVDKRDHLYPNDDPSDDPSDDDTDTDEKHIRYSSVKMCDE